MPIFGAIASLIFMETPDLILLNIGFAVHHADWNYKNVNSPFARIYLVTEGNAKLHICGRVRELTPGHLYFIPPFTMHSYECDSDYALYYIHIYENQPSGDRLLEDFIFSTEIPASPVDEMVVKRLYEINPGRELRRYDPREYDNSSTLLRTISIHTRTPADTMLETKGLLYVLCSHFLKDAVHKYEITDNRIRKILRYIRIHIDEPVRIEDLCGICCLSKDHFIRLFKKELKQTPVRYINQKKIEKAQLKIIAGEQSVQDIAYGLSFDNISYFNRLFKRYTGVSPGQYKALSRNQLEAG